MRKNRSSSFIWSVGTLLIAIPIALPILIVVLSLFSPSTEVWTHLRNTVLLGYLTNTIALLVIVAIFTTIIGVSTAWLIATKKFPGRRLFSWLLVLPIAAPAYVVAYAYGDLLDYAGPIQSQLRALFDWGATDYWFPEIRSLFGAAFVLSFVLYPYVYLLAFTTFSRQSGTLSEAARTLGLPPWKAFISVGLPVARPAIAGGVLLALMETAADYGVVEFFGVATLTNGIFRTWYAQGDHLSALQLSAWLFVVVATLVLCEYFARKGQVANPISRDRPNPRDPLKGRTAFGAIFLCSVPFIFGFLFPISRLIFHAIIEGDPTVGRSFLDYVRNTVLVAGTGSILAVFAAVWLCYSVRLQPTRFVRVGVRVSTLGYALPGMVLAVGLIGPLTTLDKWIAPTLAQWFQIKPQLWITGSVAALIFVYIARFLTVAYNTCESGLSQIHPLLDGAARSLGATPGVVLRKIHMPLLLPAILSATLLVFIDIAKELPATLVLRPFNFETLATRAYRLASDERIGEAATAAITIVLVGLLPALLLSFQTFHQKGPTK